MLKRAVQNHWMVFAGYFVLAVFLRFFSFFPSVINHDESTYILIGQQLLEGDIYFVDAVDTKPIGIFLIYACFQWLVGNSIFLMRLLVTLIIVATAVGLFKFGLKALKSWEVGFASGIIYIFFISIWTFYGVSPNCEQIFVLFTVCALWLIWDENALWRFGLAGLLLGMGFIIKYVVLLDGVAIGLFLLWQWHKSSGAFSEVMAKILIMIVGASIPFLLMMLYYGQLGLWDIFIHHTFGVGARYGGSQPWWERIMLIFDFPLRFLPFFLLIYGVLRTKNTDYRIFKQFLGIWILCIMMVIFWMGKIFGHYTIQLMPACSLLAGMFFLPACQKPKWFSFFSRPLGMGVFAVVIALISVIKYFEFAPEKDATRLNAQILNARLGPDDLFYTGNTHQILYFLLDRKSPTRFVHRSLLWDGQLRNVLNIDLEEETRNILQQNPRFILLNQNPPENILLDSIHANYVLIEILPNKDQLFERK